MANSFFCVLFLSFLNFVVITMAATNRAEVSKSFVQGKKRSNGNAHLPRNKRQFDVSGRIWACSILCDNVDDQLASPLFSFPEYDNFFGADIVSSLTSRGQGGHNTGDIARYCNCEDEEKIEIICTNKGNMTRCKFKCDKSNPVERDCDHNPNKNAHKNQHKHLHSSLSSYARSYCVCSLEYSPVCGLDGETYSNECRANCEGVSVAYSGTCLNPQYICDHCELEYSPVCGTDGRKYNNVCLLECAGVTLAFPLDLGSDASQICLLYD